MLGFVLYFGILFFFSFSIFFFLIFPFCFKIFLLDTEKVFINLFYDRARMRRNSNTILE